MALVLSPVIDDAEVVNTYSSPNAKIGRVASYIVDSSAFTEGIMKNSAKKCGSAVTFEIMHSAPQPIELQQIHYAIDVGTENNSNDSFIANLEEVCEGKWLKLTTERDGSFQVYNSRNKFEKTYPKK